MCSPSSLVSKNVSLSRYVCYLSPVTAGIRSVIALCVEGSLVTTKHHHSTSPIDLGFIGETGIVYLSMSLGCLARVYFYVPEEKGRSNREADIMFNRHVAAR